MRCGECSSRSGLSFYSVLRVYSGKSVKMVFEAAIPHPFSQVIYAPNDSAHRKP